MSMRRGERGLTLTEILIASTLTVAVILGVTSIDMTRVRLDQELHQRSGTLVLTYGQAALAVRRLAKEFDNADRIVLLAPDAGGVSADVQVRLPPTTGMPPALDAAASYTWNEYKRVGNELRAYRNTAGGCPAADVLARDITGLTFQFADEAPAPPGADGLTNGRDNNMLRYQLDWAHGTRSHTFQGHVAIRSAPYSNVNVACPAAGPCSSGSGLTPPGVSAPPGSC